MHEDLLAVRTHCPDAVTAEAIAEAVVASGLAPCANVLPPICSVYVWKGETVRAEEVPFQVKAPADRFDALAKLIAEATPTTSPPFGPSPSRRPPPPTPPGSPAVTAPPPGASLAPMNRQAPPRRRPATYQDVLDAPPHMVAEIIDGALVLHPRPAPPHAVAHSALTGELFRPFQRGKGGPGGWWIISEPELHLGPQVLVPDLAGWRRSEMPAIPQTAFFEQRPAWVCAVLSPSTRKHDLTAKRDTYGRFGVEHMWLVDPLARTLEVFASKGGAWTLRRAVTGERAIPLEPFDAVEFDLGALWPEGLEAPPDEPEDTPAEDDAPSEPGPPPDPHG